MTGYIENNRIYVELQVYGVNKILAKPIKTQIDTGYDGYLILPFQDAIPLGLILKGTQSYTLADGNTNTILVCWGNVEVNGKAEFVPIDIGQKGNALLGQAFLKQANIRMNIDYSKSLVKFDVSNPPASSSKAPSPKSKK